MAGIESEIRWGTGYDNVLAFTYPTGLDDVRTWRRPAPGSRRTRNAAGTTDSWINRRDFVLAGRARWFAHQYWGGARLQDFLDWAGEGNAFRFLPDTRYPNFNIGDCYLDEPFDDPAPVLEEADGSQAIDIVIRQQAYDFHLARRGLLFEYVPGKSITDPSSMAATYTRATTANRIGRDTVLASQASGELRDRHFVDANGTRTTLLEKASDNECLQSEDFGTTWVASGTPTRSAAAHTASGVTLDLIGDDTAGAVELYSQTITFTGDAAKAISVFVKKGTSAAASGSLILLQDTTAGANRLLATLTWSGTVPSLAMTNGTYHGYEGPFRGDVYRLMFTTESINAANTNSMQVRPAGTSAEQGNLYAGGVQCEDSVFPTSYKKTTTVAVTRNADSLYFPFAFVPQELTLYVKGYERGTGISTTSSGLVAIGGSTDASLILLNDGANAYQAMHRRSVDVTATAGSSPVWGDLLELRIVLSTTGTVLLGQAKNSGTETTSISSANDLATAWVAERIYIGERSGSAAAFAFQVVRVAAGTRTLAEMRAI